MNAPHRRGYEGCGQDSAPYVLGALTETEHEAFVAHLETCAVCRDEVAALGVVAAALPAAVAQTSAPRDLKRRVMSTVQAEAELRGASERAGAPRRRLSSGRPGSPRGWWHPLVASLAGAAVVAVVAVVLASGGGGTRVIRAQVSVPGVSASLRVRSDRAELTIAGMPQSPPGHVYEVWVKRAGAPQPTDALFTVSRAGDATVAVPGRFSGVTAVMVTAEPEGGSRVPTTTPVIVASLS